MTITQARKAALAKRFGVDCKLTEYSWVQAMDDDVAGTISLYYEDMEWIIQATGSMIDNCTTTTGRETGIYISCNVNADVYVNNVRVGTTNSIIELDTTPMVLLISSPGYVPKQWAIQLTEGSIWNTTIDLVEISAGRETGLFVSCNVSANVLLNNVSIGITGQIITLSQGTKLLIITADGYDPRNYAVQISEGSITNLQITLEKTQPGRDTGIFVDCNVQADIYVNNENVGSTEEVITLPTGTHTLMLVRQGYVTRTYATQVRTGSITNIQITMYEAVAGKDTGVFVDCNVIANIYLNNINIGQSGQFIAVPEGTIRILLTRNGYVPRTWATQVTNGNITNVQISLQEVQSTNNTGLYIDCNVTAKISINGEVIGNTNEFIVTEPGTKQLMIAANGYETKSYATQVTGGYITNLQITLVESSGTKATGIFVDCNVAAEVYEGTSKIGITGEVIPMTIGTKTLTISKTGYKTKTWTAQVTNGSITNISITLTEDTTQTTGLSVNCNVPARVWIDNIDVGQTGEIIVTSPGAKLLLIIAEGYKSKTYATQVTEGNITNIQITLDKETETETTGMLIDCNVIADVYENGTKIGVTGETIEASEGTHSLTISSTGFISKTWSVTITEGNITNTQVTLYAETEEGAIEGENGVEYTITILKDGTGAPITSKPTTIQLGTPQWYSIMVKNDEETTWMGYLGIKLTDGLGNAYTHEPNKQYSQSVAKGETKSIKAQITIPADTTLSGTVTITFLLRGYRVLTT
jgi:hypothetical protein